MPATISKPGLRTTKLNDNANLVFGQGFSFNTKGAVEPGRLILAVRLVLDATFTQPAAAQQIQFGEVFRQMIARLNIGRRINVTGLGAIAHEWAKTGRQAQFPGDIPATANGVFQKRIEWTIYYSSPLARNPFDGAVPSDVWNEQVTGNLGAASIFAATAPTLSNATLRCYVDHVAASAQPGKVKVGVSQVFMDDGFTNLSPLIAKAGAFLYAVIYREVANDRGRITSANISNVTSKIDGVPQILNARAEDVASMFNRWVATEASRGGSSPVYGQAAGSIDDQPDQAAAAAQSSLQMEMVPAIIIPRGFNISQVARAKQSLSLELSGNLAAYRVAYGYIEPRSEDSFSKAASQMGLKRGVVRAKTASKTGLPPDADLAPYLPAVVEGSGD
jgi:hypothetical protein